MRIAPSKNSFTEHTKPRRSNQTKLALLSRQTRRMRTVGLDLIFKRGLRSSLPSVAEQAHCTPGSLKLKQKVIERYRSIFSRQFRRVIFTGRPALPQKSNFVT